MPFVLFVFFFKKIKKCPLMPFRSGRLLACGRLARQGRGDGTKAQQLVRWGCCRQFPRVYPGRKQRKKRPSAEGQKVDISILVSDNTGFGFVSWPRILEAW